MPIRCCPILAESLLALLRVPSPLFKLHVHQPQPPVRALSRKKTTCLYTVTNLPCKHVNLACAISQLLSSFPLRPWNPQTQPADVFRPECSQTSSHKATWACLLECDAPANSLERLENSNGLEETHPLPQVVKGCGGVNSNSLRETKPW